MNKKELIDTISKHTGFAKNDISLVIESFTNAVSDCLVRGEDVKINGFGTFTITEWGARKGRNPATGEIIEIAATKTPKFKAGSILKEAVKNN